MVVLVCACASLSASVASSVELELCFCAVAVLLSVLSLLLSSNAHQITTNCSLSPSQCEHGSLVLLDLRI